jgi:hypothetical protein
MTKLVASAAANANPYFTAPDKAPKIDWEWMLVVGVFLGAFASSKLSGTDGRLLCRSFGHSGSDRPLQSASPARSLAASC